MLVRTVVGTRHWLLLFSLKGGELKPSVQTEGDGGAATRRVCFFCCFFYIKACKCSFFFFSLHKIKTWSWAEQIMGPESVSVMPPTSVSFSTPVYPLMLFLHCLSCLNCFFYSMFLFLSLYSCKYFFFFPFYFLKISQHKKFKSRPTGLFQLELGCW